MEFKNTSNILQIDLLKGLAILIVVIGHIVAYQVTNPQVVPTVSKSIFEIPKNTQIFDFIYFIDINNFYHIFTHWITYSALFTEQVIPIFIIIMSFNLSLAYHRRVYSKLKQYYSLNEMKKKFRRYFIPYIFIFSICVIYGILFFLITNRQILYLNFRLLLGYLPINGPGNYFITLIFQMILFFPFLFIFYKFNRHICLIVVFFLAFFCEIFNHFGINGLWYTDSLVRFFPHIILGIWISDLYLKSQLKNKYFIFFGIFSGFYLIFISQFENGVLGGIRFSPYTASQNLFGCGWSALILIIGLLYLPEVNNFVTKPIAIIGKASYHIFLIQIVYFRLFGSYGLKYHSLIDLFSINNLMYIGISLSIVILCGIGFYLFDKHNFYIRFNPKNSEK
jgi:peptidoglycan/LPS O-acetylase OafA/YrhL